MTTTKTILFASIVVAFLPTLAIAQTPQIQGYLLDSRGAVVKNNYGQCWRTGYWTPAMAVVECDPDLVKKVEAPAPKLAAATPEPAPAPMLAPVAPPRERG